MNDNGSKKIRGGKDYWQGKGKGRWRIRAEEYNGSLRIMAGRRWCRVRAMRRCGKVEDKIREKIREGGE